MADEEKFSKAIDSQRRRERDAAVDRARRGEGGGFSETDDYMHETDGVPDKIFPGVEVGAGWMDAAEDHAAEN